MQSKTTNYTINSSLGYLLLVSAIQNVVINTYLKTHYTSNTHYTSSTHK